MRIAVDVMGGDRGCGVAVGGVKLALREYSHISELLLVGRDEDIQAALREQGCSDSRITVEPASQVLTMEDKPREALRKKKDSSRKLLNLGGTWGPMTICDSCKYLGFELGPGKGDKSWIAPWRKCNEKIRLWSSQALGLDCQARTLNTFILLTLTFIAQLESPPQWLELRLKETIAKIPKPGNDISLGYIRTINEQY